MCKIIRRIYLFTFVYLSVPFIYIYKLFYYDKFIAKNDSLKYINYFKELDRYANR